MYANCGRVEEAWESVQQIILSSSLIVHLHLRDVIAHYNCFPNIVIIVTQVVYTHNHSHLKAFGKGIPRAALYDCGCQRQD
jgi:hypothetical protein